MRVVAIVQARMGSTRLPGKVLKDLAGQTVLARVVNRTRRAKLLDEVVVATSINPADDVIVQECERLPVDFFRGAEGDVLDRYYRAAQKFAADAIVRITSDCPLIDAGIIDSAIRVFFDQEADYVSNSLALPYPPGLDVEVFTMESLAYCWNSANEEYQRTHVTPYMYEVPGRFKVAALSADKDYSDCRWTLDTAEDLELIRAIYRQLDDLANTSWRKVLDLMNNQPHLADLNAHVRPKALREG